MFAQLLGNSRGEKRDSRAEVLKVLPGRSEGARDAKLLFHLRRGFKRDALDAAKLVDGSQADNSHPPADPFIIGVAQIQRGADASASKYRRISRPDSPNVGDGHTRQRLFLIGRSG